LQYVGGVKISDFIGLRQCNYDTGKIAARLVDALFKQVYNFGFFHADPHPGNLAIGEGEKIVFYDFGQVGTIDQVTREKGMNMIIGMMRYDVNAVTRSILDIAIASKPVNYGEFRHDVARLQQKYFGLPLSQIHVAQALAELLDLSLAYQMRLPVELSLLIKMLMTVENIAAQLDPNLSIVNIAEPYGRKLLIKKYSPANLRKGLAEIALDYAEVGKELPREIHNILKSLEEGELKIKLEHANIIRLISRIDLMSNRLALAIILGSTIIGTSLVAYRSTNHILNRIPLVECGFIVSLIVSLFLVYSILRSGKF